MPGRLTGRAGGGRGGLGRWMQRRNRRWLHRWDGGRLSRGPGTGLIGRLSGRDSARIRSGVAGGGYAFFKCREALELARITSVANITGIERKGSTDRKIMNGNSFSPISRQTNTGVIKSRTHRRNIIHRRVRAVTFIRDSWIARIRTRQVYIHTVSIATWHPFTIRAPLA